MWAEDKAAARKRRRFSLIGFIGQLTICYP
jgi:hypothetical protein